MKATIESTHPTKKEFAVKLNGQLIGWIGKCDKKLWSVRGMGEQLHPVCTETKREAIAMLIEASKS